MTTSICNKCERHYVCGIRYCKYCENVPKECPPCKNEDELVNKIIEKNKILEEKEEYEKKMKLIVKKLSENDKYPFKKNNTEKMELLFNKHTITYYMNKISNYDEKIKLLSEEITELIRTIRKFKEEIEIRNEKMDLNMGDIWFPII